MKQLLFASFTIALILFCNTKTVQAQNNEFGVWFGGANYYGDINRNFSFKHIRPAGGILYKRNLNQYIAIKGTAGYGRIGGSDSLYNNVYQQTRNLSFTSDIYEASAQIELNFFRYELQNINHFFTPYLSTGLAFFHYKPMAELDGEMFSLQELGTEGQSNPDISGKQKYSLNEFAIPIGLGFKYWVAGQWTFGMDVTYRKTRTDFLDDVNDAYVDDFILDPTAADLADQSPELGNTLGFPDKQRGNRINNDDYLFGSVVITYTLKDTKCPYANKGVSGKLRKKKF